MNSPSSNKKKYKLKELAQILKCPYQGDGETEITGVASIDQAKKGDLTFFTHPKLRPLLEKTKASAVIIALEESFNRLPVLKAKNPHLIFAKALSLFFEPYLPCPGIHSTAIISSPVKMGKDVSIGAFCYIGENSEIGDHCIIFPLVTIYPQVKIGKETIIHSLVSIRERVIIGDQVIIHNGAVIGSDGFGYAKQDNDSYYKIPQTGEVVIGNEVEIGANTTIDRATLGKTIIHQGVKIDNLVQVAHNVEIGAHSILAGQTGIAGSTKIGKKVVLGGQVGITDHIKIGDEAIAAAKTGITGNVPDRAFIAGIPHTDIKTWRKAYASLPRLYDLIKEVRHLKARIEELEKIVNRKS
ncbi:MAG: UDP-3-O-(3-hydroxymyristoyl)glucosamine N-acyltransferase [Candidatus Aminicenantia bacterium]